MNRVTAIILAAGEGRRYGAAKQFALLGGRTVLDHSLEKFQAHEAVDRIVLVLPKGRPGKEFCERYGKIVAVARGGEKRQDSVYAGLNGLDAHQAEIILVHDGARPLVGMDLIGRLIEATREKGAVVPVIPVEDTIKCVEDQRVFRTEDRSRLFRSQTPQGFFYSLLKEAFVRAIGDSFYGTDEAVLVERMGRDVFVVRGERKNMKITTREDLKMAEALIED